MFDHSANYISANRNINYYDSRWRRLDTGRDYTEIARIRFIVDVIFKIKSKKNIRILDLGCGTGWMAPYLSSFGSVEGIDFSTVGIEIARKEYGQHGQFYVADVNHPKLGLPTDAIFDVVVCSEVIEHVPQHLNLLLQINAFLRPSGWCVLTTPNGNVWSQFDKDPRYKSDQQPVENWITTSTLQDLLGRAGFRIALHEGRPVYEFRQGVHGFLQRRKIEAFFKSLGLESWYYKAILPTALYQVVAAEKVKS